MKLYHGTSERWAREIWRHGLWPRADLETEGNWSHTVESAEDCVYLTVAYAPYFAFCAAEDKERWAIVEVDSEQLDEDALLPDEDFLEQVLRQQKEFDDHWLWDEFHELETMEDRTRWCRDHAHVLSSWQESLNGIGNCAHTGHIPPEAITRIVLFDPWEEREGHKWARLMAVDPSISVLNFQLVGEKYRALTDWFMGARVDAEFCGRFYSMLGQVVGNPLDMAKQAEALSDRIVEVWQRGEEEKIDGPDKSTEDDGLGGAAAPA